MAWAEMPREQWLACFEYDYSEEDIRWNLDHAEAVLVLHGLLDGEEVRATYRATEEDWKALDALWDGEGDPVETATAIDQWFEAHMTCMEKWDDEDDPEEED